MTSNEFVIRIYEGGHGSSPSTCAATPIQGSKDTRNIPLDVLCFHPGIGPSSGPSS